MRKITTKAPAWMDTGMRVARKAESEEPVGWVEDDMVRCCLLGCGEVGDLV
jgi:hypothetical protein